MTQLAESRVQRVTGQTVLRESWSSIVNELDAKKNCLIDLDDLVGVEFECRECQAKRQISLEELSADQVRKMFVDHGHLHGPSDQLTKNLSTIGGDLQNVWALLRQLRGTGEIMDRRNLKLRFQAKRRVR
jgi:hypothetical protein